MDHDRPQPLSLGGHFGGPEPDQCDQGSDEHSKGQTAITNWLQLLLVRTRRHANHRAATNAERARAGVIAAVQSAFEVPTPGERNYPRAPVRKSDRLLKMQADFDTLTK